MTAEVVAVTMEGAGAEVASGTIDLPGSKTTTGTRTGAEEEGTGEDLHTEGLHLQGAGRHQVSKRCKIDLSQLILILQASNGAFLCLRPIGKT